MHLYDFDVQWTAGDREIEVVALVAQKSED
jgi:hypothetical protein